MRAGQIVLVTTLLAAGAVVARPQEVVPLASRLIAPLLVRHEPAEATAELPEAAQLPGFVPPNKDLPLISPAAARITVADAEAKPQSLALAPANAPVPTGTPAVSGTAAEPQPGMPGGVPAPANAPPEAGAMVAVEAAIPAAAAALAVPPVAAAFAPAVPQAPLSGGLDGEDGYSAEAVRPNGSHTVAAKKLFGAIKKPAPLAARSIGAYSRGCLAGAMALPVDGPAWQAMRLSRNRNWGHPNLIALVERFATDAQRDDKWPGLLVGDISQPRGGPMLTGHASHQVGLDADIWLTPMPNRKLSNREREDIAATSMLDKTELAVDPNVFTPAHVKLIRRAASYPEVERVLVHPAIKKALCRMAEGDRRWLGKVRPIYGHYFHFHVRIACPPGSVGCVPQKPPPGDDGCGKEVDEWLARLAVPPKPPVPGVKPEPPPHPVTMAQLPAECRAVLASGPDGIQAPPDERPAVRSATAGPLHRALTLRPRAVRHARQ